MTAPSPFDAIVVAAGSGSRAGGAKQWRLLGGRTVARRAVAALSDARQGVLVVPPGDEPQGRAALKGLDGWRVVAGATDRAGSVRAGLQALDGDADTPILVHDAARPLLPAAVITSLLTALEDADGALPALPCADSLRRGENDWITGAQDREGLFRAQTPQAFCRRVLIAALDQWSGAAPPTDEAEAVLATGGRVRLVQGDPRLMKLTYPEDFAMAEALLPRQIRVGTGFDVHRWGPGASVWLCGVEIPHNQTLIGHSDADAGLHALTDALLGAIGEGDIGDHFPPSDPQWKGAASDRFLVHAADLIRGRGGRIVNVDVTLICEQPKVKPHRHAMRERLAELLAIPLDAVSVKATTTEALGFTGRGEGLAAQAACSVELPA